MATNNNKIIILGASNMQVPIMKKAKEMGLFVIVASIDGDYPGFKIADKVYKVDILDKENLLEIARNEHIDGITTDQIDLAVPSVAYVAEALNLPGIGCDCAKMFTDKYTMREQSRLAGVPVPEYDKTQCVDQAIKIAQKIGYPVIIKPTDVSGSKGVFRINSEDELLNKFDMAKNQSLSSHVMIENYIVGDQYLAHGFVENYKLRVFAFANRYYFDIPYHFLPNYTIFPALITENLKQRMCKYYNKLVLQMKPRFGSTFTEWIYDKQNDILYLAEISMRGSGAFITSDLIPLAYNIDAQPHLIKYAINKPFNSIFEQKLSNRASGYLCFLLPEGVISDVQGINEITKIDGVYKSYLRDIRVNEKILPVKHKGSREGPILIYGENRQQLAKTINEIKSIVHITVNTDAGPKGIIWE